LVQIIEEAISHYGQKLLGWRHLPVRPNFGKGLGATAAACEPHMEQIFVGAGDGISADSFDKVLFGIRKKAGNDCSRSFDEDKTFYICSLSNRVITYKGMLTAHQLLDYFEDLNDEDCESHVALVHSRFATNTFPGWKRAHPYRYMCHNGEINTVRGNMNWQAAREGVMSSPTMPNFAEMCPIVEAGGSDSTAFDNVLELLIMGGRTLPEACLMMMPEAWQNNEVMSEERKAFYKYHSAVMEPWDGPALVAFTDGLFFGATLDRNGLRPCRYYLTKSGRVIGGSEVGVLPIDDADVVHKGRLEPGKMFLIDFAKGKMISDEEYKAALVSKEPYADWLSERVITMDKLISASSPSPSPAAEATVQDGRLRNSLLRTFGYTTETLELLIHPMASHGMEGLGSMGNDVPLACLSSRSRTVFDYFKQLFAQVTNPPIDPIRESIVMSLECFVGPERNILASSPEHVERLYLQHPVLKNEEMAAIKNFGVGGYKAVTLDATFPISDGEGGLKAAIARITAEAHSAVTSGASYIILSDRATCQERVPIPALLAGGAVHHHLVKSHTRTQAAIISESGEPREVTVQSRP
jgi:glutamate synthase (NADPH/NADH) large chain